MIGMFRICFFLFLLLSAGSAFSQDQRKYSSAPEPSFASDKRPPEVDYSKDESWAALPWRKDMADSLPKPNLTDGQNDAAVDVFFVHPTIYYKEPSEKYHWNGDVNDQGLNGSVDGSTILNQASVFNGSCKVYAPRYRQAHISAFYTNDRESGEAALELAYQDVKKAFLYYLAHHNNGRPFIIASHSQGTRHAGRLLKEEIEGTKLEKQFVVAYLVGMPVPPDYFASFKACDQPDKTDCFVSWCTYQDGFYPFNYEIAGFDKAICVNPLSWRTDTLEVSRKSNLGGITWKFNKVVNQVSNARIHKGMLWIEKPHVPGRRLIKMNNYHVADYNLFWFNIRENVRVRCAAFLLAKGSDGKNAD